MQKLCLDFCVSNMTLANYVLDFVWKKKWKKDFLVIELPFFHSGVFLLYEPLCFFYFCVSYFTLVCFVFFCSKLKSPIKSSPIGSCTGRTHENHDISMEHGNLMVRKVYSDTILVSLPEINVKDYL